LPPELFKSITRPDLVVGSERARGTLNAAGKIRQWLHQIRYGLAKGVLDVNPATDLNMVAALAKAARHHPHVTFAELTELTELLAKTDAAKTHALTQQAIRLIVLTAVHLGELRAAPWKESP
jgi:hypothetical protein